jgi:hypothetical protein
MAASPAIHDEGDGLILGYQHSQGYDCTHSCHVHFLVWWDEHNADLQSCIMGLVSCQCQRDVLLAVSAQSDRDVLLSVSVQVCPVCSAEVTFSPTTC